MRRHANLPSLVPFAVIAVLLVALAACGGDDGSSSAVTTTSTTVPGIEEPPTCEEWMGRPVAANEVEKGCAVPLDDGLEGHAQAGMAAIECDDGRIIYWGDAGWGYVGEPMQAHDQTELVAPQAERDACGVPPLPPTVPPPPLPE